MANFSGSRPGGLWQRRELLRAGALAGTAGLLPWPALAAAAVPADRDFIIIRKGSKVGVQRVEFAPTEGGFTAHTIWDLAVKVAFVTVYSYQQDGLDRWQDGRLVASEISTDDNGKKTRVQAKEEGGKLHVEGPGGSYQARSGTMVDTAFWNKAVVGEKEIIDSQNGDLVPVKITGPVDDTLTAGGRQLATVRYGFAGTAGKGGEGRSGVIWYDGEDRWVQAEIHTRGEVLLLQLPG